MAVHGIMSSYFGDYEWDIGKSVRWFTYFCDTEYVMDINLGSSRRFLLSWTKSFPNVAFSYNSVFPFFEDLESAAQWRYESFLAADRKWSYDDDDWIVFVDCSEGLCVDNITSPLNVGSSDWDDLVDEVDDRDPLTPMGAPPSGITSGSILPPPHRALEDANPFKDYILGEIEAAELVDGPGTADVIYLPVWAYVGDTAPYTVDMVIDQALQDEIDAADPGDMFNGLTAEEAQVANTSITTTTQSKYVFAGYSARMFKASYLRDVMGSDLSQWEKIDTYESSVVESEPEYTPKQYLSIISYAYARWSSDQSKMTWDREPVAEEYDDGWEMRKKISNVRPLVSEGFQVTDWDTSDSFGSIEWGWQPDVLDIDNASSDVSGSLENQFASEQFSSAFLDFERDPIPEASELWPAGFPVLGTPLYTNVFRDNPRDGLFYESGEIGPVPWNFVSNKPAVDPVEWEENALKYKPQVAP